MPDRFDDEDPGGTHRYGGTHEASAHAASAWRTTLAYLEVGLGDRHAARSPP